MSHASILIIDDSQIALNRFRDILEETSLFQEIFLAANAEDGLSVAASRPLDMILCDICMPGLDGFNFLALRNEREELRHVPVIMITVDEHSDSKVKALELGASDYVTKPFSPDELLARIKVHLKIKALQDSLQQHNRLLDQYSKTDPLTGLVNRRGLREALEREFLRSLRKETPLAIVLVDIDHFKAVNDTYGHPQGDSVLTTVADLLRRDLRPYDVAARYGGEEFLLVFPDTDLAAAFQVAERIRKSIAGQQFPAPLQPLHLTISLGVAATPDSRIQNLDDLIREADCALYLAKRNGRNRTETMPL